MRVVIAEDLVLLRDGMARILTDAGMSVIAQVGDASSLITAVDSGRPDLAIMDVRMPPSFTDEGARAAMLLRDRFPSLAVVVLSNIVEPRLAILLTERGPAAFGYLLKDRVLDVESFVATVQHVASGGTVIDESIVDSLLNQHASRLAGLSARELDVLGMIARGLSNAGIGAALFVSERTVDAHVRSIFQKLDLLPSADENRRVQAALAWFRAQDPTA